jgi:hypothetical protein
VLPPLALLVYLGNGTVHMYNIEAPIFVKISNLFEREDLHLRKIHVESKIEKKHKINLFIIYW